MLSARDALREQRQRAAFERSQQIERERQERLEKKATFRRSLGKLGRGRAKGKRPRIERTAPDL